MSASTPHASDRLDVVRATLDQVTARGLVVAAIAASVLVGLLDDVVTGRVHVLFNLAFVGSCLAAAALIKPRDFFTAAVMPPIVLGAAIAVLALVDAPALATHGATFSQGLLGGIARHAWWLVATYVATLAIVGVRSARR